MGVREGEGWVVRHEYRLREGLVGRRFSDEELQVARRAADEQDVQVVDDAAAHPGVNQETRRLFEAQSILVVPLIAREEVVGVIYFIYHSRIHRFSSAEADFARRLSVSLGLAIANARLFEAERDIADRLQEALLTLPDSVAGIEFANAYHSASEAARVGGDFYDLFPLDHDHVGVVIGDVAGKGLDAAVLTSMVKNTLRAHATERGKTPKQIVTLTNDLVYRATPTESFVTVFFGILDCRDGRLVYSNAGHTTAAVVREDGSAGRLSVTGPLLGAFGDVEFDQAEVRLDLDEILFLYTDGLTEARRDHELFGEERLFAFLGSTGVGVGTRGRPEGDRGGHRIHRRSAEGRLGASRSEARSAGHGDAPAAEARDVSGVRRPSSSAGTPGPQFASVSRWHHLAMFTARATSTPTIVADVTDCTPMTSLARCDIGIVSVGEKAVAFVSDTYK